MSSPTSIGPPQPRLQHALWHVRFDSTQITERFEYSERTGGKWSLRDKFRGPLSAGPGAKVYIFSDCTDGWPFYVGMTKGGVGTRFGSGWRASSTNRVNGYAGYAFKNELPDSVPLSHANLHVFSSITGIPALTEKDAKCIEAEVVYRIRKEGAWPRFQTEIHFSRPEEWHEAAAEEIMGTFRSLRAKPLALPPDQ